MEFKANCAIVFRGEHVRKGQVVDMTADEAATLGGDVSPVDEAAPAPAEKPPFEVPLEEMNLAQLKERSKELGLAATGSKADLLERITLHLGAPAPTEEDEITSD